jgi:hypothetical protein
MTVNKEKKRLKDYLIDIEINERINKKTKRCSKCKKRYPATTEYFSKRKNGKKGLDSWCKNCHRIKSKKLHIRKTYGITFEELKERMKKQNNQCLICKREFKDLSEIGRYNISYPRIDHNHKTGEIRGILCDYCNRMLLGAVDDNIFILVNAIKYLKKHKRLFV